MKNVVIILAALMTGVLSSCNENRVFEEHADPSGNLEWNKNQVISFDIEIIDTSTKYNQILALRFAYGYAFSFCDISVIEKTPSGETNTFSHQFKTMNEKGYAGDGSGDIFDLEDLWRPNHSFPELGTYHYELRHVMPDDKIHMVMEVGMILDKVPASTTQ